MASKYFAASYEAVQDLPMPPEAKALQAATCGSLFVALGQFSEALSYYGIAMKNVKAVKPISLRSALGVTVQDLIAGCLCRTGRHESAEQVFKDSIENYAMCQGHYALLDPSRAEAGFLGCLDEGFANAMMNYGLLVALLNRPDEVSAIRQQLTRVVRRSTVLRFNEPTIMDEFDDILRKVRQHNDLKTAVDTVLKTTRRR